MTSLFFEFKIADEKACKARWLGLAPGEGFFCAFCGHQFQVGDEYRFIYTNDIPGASGNPLCCRGCFDMDGRVDGLRKRWVSMNEEHRTRFKWWHVHDGRGDQ